MEIRERVVTTQSAGIAAKCELQCVTSIAISQMKVKESKQA